MFLWDTRKTFQIMKSKRFSMIHAVSDKTKKKKIKKNWFQTRACNEVFNTQTYANKVSTLEKLLRGAQP